MRRLAIALRRLADAIDVLGGVPLAATPAAPQQAAPAATPPGAPRLLGDSEARAALLARYAEQQELTDDRDPDALDVEALREQARVPHRIGS